MSAYSLITKQTRVGRLRNDQLKIAGSEGEAHAD